MAARERFESIEALQRAAEQGDKDAQYNLAFCYAKGQGVAQDHAEATRWYRKAAEQGDAASQYSLALCYAKGKGIARDDSATIKWLRAAAENGDTNAQTLLATYYYTGDHVPRSYTEAARWSRLAAEAGDADGQILYGTCLYCGRGVPEDSAAGIKWYAKAADQQNATAQFNLGLCYVAGKGTVRDFAEARKWFQLAAEQKYPDANYQLRALFFRKHGIFKWRNAVLWAFGSGFLAYHAFTRPFTFHASAVGAFLLILVACGVFAVAVMIVAEKFGLKSWHENEAQHENNRIFRDLKREPWRLLFVPAEDGCFLLPLLYIGINPASAAIAASLFAAAHYPFYPWKYCVPKGIAYFFVALWVLPYGIWSVIAAHVLLDVALFGLELLIHSEEMPTWRRLFRALRTE